MTWCSIQAGQCGTFRDSDCCVDQWLSAWSGSYSKNTNWCSRGKQIIGVIAVVEIPFTQELFWSTMFYLDVLLISTSLLVRNKILLLVHNIYLTAVFVITFKNHIFTLKTTLLITTYLHSILLVYKSQHIYWKLYSVCKIGRKLNCNFETSKCLVVSPSFTIYFKGLH